MIDKDNIERKDFFCILPVIIDKIQFIGFSLMLVEDKTVCGSGFILDEIVEDLKAIDKALYLESEVV